MNTQTIIQKAREVTPLFMRVNVGPFVAYGAYILRVYIKRNPEAPHVLSINETLDLILEKKLSVIRFGDGEMSIIDNIDLGFQKKNELLAQRLKEVITTDIPGLLICIPNIFGKLDYLAKTGFWFTLHHLFKHIHKWKAVLSKTQIYGDAFITRPYIGVKDKTKAGEIFKKVFRLWENQDVVLIEGKDSRLGVGNDLFTNVRSLKRILCPSENAFSAYEAILAEALKINKNTLILMSLGPTAKVLAYDLYRHGYRIIDIGHIDMEYEMFLRKEETLRKVAYKYFNEINERNPEECTDPDYIGEIIATIE